MSNVESTTVDRPRHHHGKLLVSSLLIVALAVLGIAGARAILAPVSDTPRLDEAIESIENEAGWLDEQSSTGHPRAYWFATSTMNFAQSRMSPAAYARLKHTTGDLPTSTEECLEQGAGICGSQVEFFIQCMNRFGIPARTVELYNRGKCDNHVVAEVLYDEQWRLFDVTWGTVFRRPNATVTDLMSVEQILHTAHSRALAVSNSTAIWFQSAVLNSSDPLDYLDWSEKDVITDGVGSVHLFPVEGPSESVVRYVPTNRPKFFGSNRTPDPDNPGSLQCILEYSGPNIAAITLDVVGTLGQGILHVQSRQNRVSVPLDEMHVGRHDIDLSELDVSEDILLSIEATSDDGIAYLVYRSIELQR